jgi:hypothetical protein
MTIGLRRPARPPSQAQERYARDQTQLERGCAKVQCVTGQDAALRPVDEDRGKSTLERAQAHGVTDLVFAWGFWDHDVQGETCALQLSGDGYFVAVILALLVASSSSAMPSPFCWASKR